MAVDYDVIGTDKTGANKRYKFRRCSCFGELNSVDRSYNNPEIAHINLKEVAYYPHMSVFDPESVRASILICGWAKSFIPELTPYYEWLVSIKRKRVLRPRVLEATKPPPVTIDCTQRSGPYMIVAFSYARIGTRVFVRDTIMDLVKVLGESVPRAILFSSILGPSDGGYRVNYTLSDNFAQKYSKTAPETLDKVQEREFALTSGGTRNTFAETRKYIFKNGHSMARPDSMFMVRGRSWTMATRRGVLRAIQEELEKSFDKPKFSMGGWPMPRIELAKVLASECVYAHHEVT